VDKNFLERKKTKFLRVKKKNLERKKKNLSQNATKLLDWRSTTAKK
jgi:hypothetical protein